MLASNLCLLSWFVSSSNLKPVVDILETAEKLSNLTMSSICSCKPFSVWTTFSIVKTKKCMIISTTYGGVGVFIHIIAVYTLCIQILCIVSVKHFSLQKFTSSRFPISDQTTGCLYGFFFFLLKNYISWFGDYWWKLALIVHPSSCS